MSVDLHRLLSPSISILLCLIANWIYRWKIFFIKKSNIWSTLLTTESGLYISVLASTRASYPWSTPPAHTDFFRVWSWYRLFKRWYLLDDVAKTRKLLHKIFFLKHRQKSLENQFSKLAIWQVEAEISAPCIIEFLNVLRNRFIMFLSDYNQIGPTVDGLEW